MKLKKTITKKAQGFLKEISVKTIGKSMPISMYEKKIEPDILFEIECIKNNYK